MAEEASESESTHQPPPPRLPFVEVECRISKKKRRFASGTKAGFAVSLINRKMDGGNPTPTPTPTPLAFAIEAVKDGEEPVSFGPDAPLVDYGNAWNLKAVTDSDYPPLTKPAAPAAEKDSHGPRRRGTVKPAGISGVYIAKILLAFVLISVLGSAFTVALQNLPTFILLLNSLM